MVLSTINFKAIHRTPVLFFVLNANLDQIYLQIFIPIGIGTIAIELAHFQINNSPLPTNR
jgi:hypothetical protein